MIGQIIAFIIFLILLYVFISYYLGLKNEKATKVLNSLFAWTDHDVREDSLQLLSSGSAVGLGLGMLITTLFGGNLIFSIVFICLGFYSVYNNWYLIRQ